MERFFNMFFNALPLSLYGIWGAIALYGLVSGHHASVFALWCAIGACVLVCRACLHTYSLSPYARFFKDFYVQYIPWIMVFLLGCSIIFMGFFDVFIPVSVRTTHDYLTIMILVFFASVNCLQRVRWGHKSLFCLLLFACCVTAFPVGGIALGVGAVVWLGCTYCPKSNLCIGVTAALWAGGLLGLPWLIHIGGKVSLWLPQVYSVSIRLLHWQELLVWLQSMLWWGYGLGYGYILSPLCTFVSLYFPHHIWVQLWLETGFFGVLSVAGLGLYGFFVFHTFFRLQAAYSSWLLALLALGMQGDLWSGFFWIGIGLSLTLWITQAIACSLQTESRAAL